MSKTPPYDYINILATLYNTLSWQKQKNLINHFISGCTLMAFHYIFVL